MKNLHLSKLGELFRPVALAVSLVLAGCGGMQKPMVELPPVDVGSNSNPSAGVDDIIAKRMKNVKRRKRLTQNRERFDKLLDVLKAECASDAVGMNYVDYLKYKYKKYKSDRILQKYALAPFSNKGGEVCILNKAKQMPRCKVLKIKRDKSLHFKNSGIVKIDCGKQLKP